LGSDLNLSTESVLPGKQMSLIQIIENNIFAVGRYWGSFNSSTSCADGIYSMNTGIEVADLNWTWNEKPLVQTDAIFIRKLKKNYNNLNLPFWWWVYPSGMSKKTKEVLLNCGFNYKEAIPCMALDLDSMQFDRQKTDDVEISFVKNDRELKIWEAISFAGFEMPQDTRSQYNEFVKAFDISKNSPQKLFLAYWQGKQAGTALLFLHGDTAGIYFVTTLTAFRSRGIALALVRRAVNYLQLLNYKYCILQSSKEGLSIYLRAGFKESCRVEVYCQPD